MLFMHLLPFTAMTKARQKILLSLPHPVLTPLLSFGKKLMIKVFDNVVLLRSYFIRQLFKIFLLSGGHFARYGAQFSCFS